MGTVLNAGSEADRLAGSVMKEIDDDTRASREAEQRLADQRKDVGPRMKIGLAVLTFLLLALTALNISGFGPFGFTPSQPTGADLRTAMSGEMDDLVDELGTYLEEFGAYPASLQEIGVNDPSWNYERLSPESCRIALLENREVVTVDLAEEGQ